jgi:hypothetical protein
MKLSRIATMIVGAALGTFAAVWLVHRRRTSGTSADKEAETTAWIELK